MTTKFFFPYIIYPQEVSEESTLYFCKSILMVDTLGISRMIVFLRFYKDKTVVSHTVKSAKTCIDRQTRQYDTKY